MAWRLFYTQEDIICITNLVNSIIALELLDGETSDELLCDLFDMWYRVQLETTREILRNRT